MAYYTPLRYPGGKRRLTPAIMRLLEENGLNDVEYVEPYAGGASVALSLLMNEYAIAVHINDLSRPVFAFWHAVLNHNADLCGRIEAVTVNMDEWHRQRAVYEAQETSDLFDLGFATLFLNRTNRSGIIGGGVIGGKKQMGHWGLDARFGKTELLARIRRVGRYRRRIHLYQKDALDLTNDLLASLQNPFVFYDPPYIEKGDALYLNDYTIDGHKALAEAVMRLEAPWVVTYDYEGAIRNGLYSGCHRIAYHLSYVAQERYGGKEVMFVSPRMSFPPGWGAGPFNMADARSDYPFYGMVEAMEDTPSGPPEPQESPEAGKRFVKALKTVLTVPKEAVPNPFNKGKKEKKPR